MRLTPLRFVLLLVGLEVMGIAGMVLWRFPWDVDDAVDRTAELSEFYAKAYSAPPALSPTDIEREARYVRIAEEAAQGFDITGMVRRFVDRYQLQTASVLDVGSGRGYLQDLVGDYTGLDISAPAARFYHKRFVVGTATAMPFSQDSFDAAWSIWVLEHIPNPESALVEFRRVVKPGGLILLSPAWNCTPWAADGYEVRPYSDFGPPGKLLKASLPLQNSSPVVALGLITFRAVGALTSFDGKPTRLHYRRLQPNYGQYWTNDSDAVNSIDSLEAVRWFESRGDECLNCRKGIQRLKMGYHHEPLIIRVNKGPMSPEPVPKQS